MMTSSIIKNNGNYDIKIAMFLYAILLTSLIAGQNLINIFGYTITSGMLIYSFTLHFIAAATELFGFKKARTMVWTTTVCNVFMISIIIAFTYLPSSAAYIGDSEVYRDFSQGMAFLMSVSTYSYVISEYINVWIISKLRALTNGKFLLLRALFSTSVATIADTLLVFPFFLTRQETLSEAMVGMFIVLGVKLIFDIIFLPLVWIIVAYVRYKDSSLNNNSTDSMSSPYSSVTYLSNIND